MTHNQINYWKLKEDTRHNIATESETNRHNVAQEGIDLGHLQETTRHNIATEGLTASAQAIDLAKLEETSRHNLATEQLTGVDLNIAAGQLAEQRRHNVESEIISGTEVKYSSLLKEAQARLTNIQGEWESILKRNEASISDAKKRQIDKQIAETEQKIKNLEKEGEKLDKDLWWYEYDKLRQGLDTSSKLTDSIVKGITSKVGAP